MLVLCNGVSENWIDKAISEFYSKIEWHLLLIFFTQWVLRLKPTHWSIVGFDLLIGYVSMSPEGGGGRLSQFFFFFFKYITQRTSQKNNLSDTCSLSVFSGNKSSSV